MTGRAQPGVTIDVDPPVIINGRPVSPLYRASSDSSSVGLRGGAHIHAIPDPDTTTDVNGHVVNPPPPLTGVWHARWSVHTLPSPGSGFYWLGAHSSLDGSSSYADPGTKLWAPDPITPSAPSWQSAFPFKPSVVAVDHYLPGGGVVHHPKGVNFNSHFIEHMWLDWGTSHRQPFTWVITACTASWPSKTYYHHLLDSGRNPYSVGVPGYDEFDCDTDRTVHESLGYRTSYAIGAGNIAMRSNETGGGPSIHVSAQPSHQPRMFVAIFNGNSSYCGVYSPTAYRLRKGAVNTGSGYTHRYYVMGRKHGVLSQDAASHLLVFDIRVWNKVLTRDQLEEQYDQVSSTYRFHEYRRT